ncbi:MAG: 3-dehydroquinate synthase [Bacteroidaceae bacterium]|nr:3-dehydroquinate synthase [Bacteroidaceae bacterium]
MKQEVITSKNLQQDIEGAIRRSPHDRLFVLTDTTTLRLCWPLVCSMPCFETAQMITIGDTDDNKTLDSLTHVWTALQEGGATRHSLLVNLGGGMVTDLGGFAASTFKRGIAYINIPTTLLSQVDASVGGKTGINFGGLKNEIGVFNCAVSVILSSEFLRSLDHKNLLSGYAEMLKHGLISDEESWAELLRFELDSIEHSRLKIEKETVPQSSIFNLQSLYSQLGALVAKSVGIKERIVEEDPTEKGLRKALNLGHTAGHALESLAMEQGRTVLHGYAVAWGLICELYLSVVKCGFPKDKFRQTVLFIRQHYGDPDIDCKQYERLYAFMQHDKKNEGNSINFTLLGGIGDIRINQQATKEEIFEMLDFLRDG